MNDEGTLINTYPPAGIFTVGVTVTEISLRLFAKLGDGLDSGVIVSPLGSVRVGKVACSKSSNSLSYTT